MKRYGIPAAIASVILAFAAVWLGGLNEDEGWYLYAANLVAEGKTLYRDFAYTQGPLLPLVYSAFTGIWRNFGLLGARIFTLALGFASILFAVGTARTLAPPERKGEAGVIAFLLLGVNLYHLYYLAIPKTYALAALFVSAGFFLLSRFVTRARPDDAEMTLFDRELPALAGLALAFAAGARISLGALLAVAGIFLLVNFRRYRSAFLYFGLAGAAGLFLIYGRYLLDPGAFAGLVAAQKYHAARGGFDVVFTVGSFSRLIRWYLPVFILLGLGVFRRGVRLAPAQLLLLLGFLSVFLVQMLAPFPYEDYQVPIISLLAVFAVSLLLSDAPGAPHSALSTPHSALGERRAALLTLGLAFAAAFSSPLLEKWMTNGQDRFWTRKKEKCELAQLRDVAKVIEAIDPGGKTLFTQDLYLAIETNRKVPEGLEMGPFATMSDDDWRALIDRAECPVAALSGYTFAIEPPVCSERPMAKQMEYFSLLKRNYDCVFKEDDFGQNATTLLVLRRKEVAE